MGRRDCRRERPGDENVEVEAEPPAVILRLSSLSATTAKVVVVERDSDLEMKSTDATM